VVVIHDRVENVYYSRRLLLATGLRDRTPDCPGFREFYGRSVFHCPDCDGFEVTGKRVAVLGEGKKIVGFTLSLRTWASHLTLITNDPINQLSDEERAKLADFDIAILNRRIARLEGDVERGVQFEEGDALPCDARFQSR
jgi:thioredoxin reductase